MLTRFYTINETKRAFDLRASDRILLLEETYIVTAYGVPRPGVVKLYVSPETDADGNLPFNPLTSVEVHIDHQIELAN